MREKILAIVVVLMLLPFVLSLCGDSRSERLGKLEAENRNLRAEIAQLRKDCAKAKIQQSGRTFTLIVIGTSVLVINNLAWVAVWRRRR